MQFYHDGRTGTSNRPTEHIRAFGPLLGAGFFRKFFFVLILPKATPGKKVSKKNFMAE
jgi:hypothetical protein